ncbi:MAG: gas vesicle protein [Alphaproteobacteria bacterium]
MAKEDTFSSKSLAEVVDRVTGTGVAIETWARISLAHVECLANEAVTDVTGADVYLKYAKAVERAVQGQQA